MSKPFTKILLAFLIAWLPAGAVHAAAGCFHAAGTHAAIDMEMHEHPSMHPAQHQPDSQQHAPCARHDCGLCYSCLAAAPGIAALRLAIGENRFMAPDVSALTSFFPDQPERPPKT